MPPREGVRIMDATEIDRALTRLAHEILEKEGGTEGLSLVGIRTRGVPLAQRKCNARRAGQDPPEATLARCFEFTTESTVVPLQQVVYQGVLQRPDEERIAGLDHTNRDDRAHARGR